MSRKIVASDLQYMGSFLTPQGSFPANDTTGNANFGSAYDGYPDPVGFNPANNSLFLKGSIANSQNIPLVAELSIPALVKPTTADITQLNVGTVLQNFGDVTGGKGTQAVDGNPRIRVCCVRAENGKYYWTSYGLYNSSGDSGVSHSVDDNQSIANPSAHDMVGLNDGVAGTGAKAGFIIGIPSSYQSLYGNNTHISGICGGSIVSQSSYGPCIVGFKLSDIGSVSPVPAKCYTFFDVDHQSALEDSVQILSCVGGAWFANSVKRGILLCLRRPVGPVWYGLPNKQQWDGDFLASGPPYSDLAVGRLPPLKPGFTQDPNFPLTAPPIQEDFTGQKYYFDLDGGDEGPHAGLGMVPQLAVADPDTVYSQTNPYDTTFDVIDMLSPTSDNPWFAHDPANPGANIQVSGMPYDEANGLLYFIHANQDGTDPNNLRPVIHCYKILAT